jgi:hypothetical protein
MSGGANCHETTILCVSTELVTKNDARQAGLDEVKIAAANANGSDGDEFAFARGEIDVLDRNGTLRGVHSKHGETVLKLYVGGGVVVVATVVVVVSMVVVVEFVGTVLLAVVVVEVAGTVVLVVVVVEVVVDVVDVVVEVVVDALTMIEPNEKTLGTKYLARVR